VRGGPASAAAMDAAAAPVRRRRPRHCPDREYLQFVRGQTHFNHHYLNAKIRYYKEFRDRWPDLAGWFAEPLQVRVGRLHGEPFSAPSFAASHRARPYLMYQLAGPLRFRQDGTSTVSMATVLRIVLRRALVQTSDTRLLPAGGTSWSSSELALVGGAEARLPELLLRLKNGDPSERVRCQRITELFTEFTQGRGCEVRLIQVQQPAQDGQASTTVQVPAIWVTVNASAGSAGLAPEVPVEFAGAGAWEALVLASVLGEPSASVVVLDEPAVALHPSLQRQLGAYLLSAPAQFLVITHSAELLPLADATDARLVRLDRDDKNATRAWAVDEACRVKMARKLVAKGNERLPFAWRAILCEGQDDVEALMTLTERMGIDLRRRNIAVTDCGGRDNIPDYVWFCAELGLKYLAVMDADSATPAALAKAQAVRDAVNLRHGGELAEFPVSLESTFGVIKQTPSLVPAAIRVLPFAGDMPNPAQAPPEVVALAEAIRRLTK
jgi:AAA domain, putative AbiEii toxin, Type IV TA system